MIKLFFALFVLTFNGLSASNTPIKIVTYNIRYDASGDRGVRDWKNRKKTVAQYLLKQNPSVIGMQEVLYSQLLDISKALPNYSYIGVGRSDGKTRGEYSPIFYKRSTWKLDPNEHGTFWLSDTPKIPNSRSWGNGIPRICTWARLIGKDDTAIYIYNTHWDHQSQASREKAAELILKTIQTRQYKNDPFILIGDFNASTENPAIKKLLASGLLTDQGKQQMLTFNQWKSELRPGLRIDHIFTSTSIKHVTVTVQASGNPPGSDHHPILATGVVSRKE